MKKIYILSMLTGTFLIISNYTYAAESASFSNSTGLLFIPFVCVPPSTVFDSKLQKISNNFTFELFSNQTVSGSSTCNANFNFDNNLLTINRIEVPVENGETLAYEVDLKLIMGSNPLRFDLVRAVELNLVTLASFAGIYDGTSIDIDNIPSPFTIQIDINGVISGFVFDTDEEETILLIGNINQQGDFTGTTINGGTFMGNISGNIIQGTFENQFFENIGTFSGTKRN